MKKRIFAIGLALCLLVAAFAGCASKPAEKTGLDALKEKGKVIMLTNAGFPPFEYLGNDNKPAGVDVDVAAEIAKDLGVTMEVVDMDFDGLINALVSGKGDFIAAGM
jgi:polar amino acid transport system substrate-binding protein